jgi:NAD(P)-dependent dehydrogenase (short-subunit alcohol dehydrogenase family)
MTTVLITGANRGIGYALTETLIKRGDRVIAMVRDPFRLPDLLKTAPREQMMVTEWMSRTIARCSGRRQP